MSTNAPPEYGRRFAALQRSEPQHTPSPGGERTIRASGPSPREEHRMTDVAARTYGLQQGTPDLKSIGPITFGPDAILFVADNASATIYAIDLAPWSEPSTSTEPVAIEHLDARLAAYLGCSREDVTSTA